MPLVTTNFHARGPVKSADMMQFVNLFTGVMNDQPVTFRNAVAIGGDQSNITVPLRIYGAPTQTTNLLDLYPDRTSAQPGFGFSAVGTFAWGPGGTAPQDTTLSRIARQNGHSSDTAGLLIYPRAEITGTLQVAGTLSVTSGGLTVVGNTSITGTLTVTGAASVSTTLTVGAGSAFNGHMDITMTPPALSNTAYQDGHIQLMSGGATHPRIGFHQTGSTALALYKEAGVERLRLKGASGNDWMIWTNETRTDADLNARYVSVSDGNNGIISARNGSLYFRSSGANYNAVFDTGTAGVYILSGPLTVGSNVINWGSDGATRIVRSAQIGGTVRPFIIQNGADGIWLQDGAINFYTPNDPQGGGQQYRPIKASNRPAATYGGGEIQLSIRLAVDGDIWAGSYMHAIGFLQTSDIRLKQGVMALSDDECMTRVRKTQQVYSYQLPPPVPPGEYAPTTTDIGFDAAEVFASNPEFAALNAGTPVAVNYANMAALVWGALRNLDARCQANNI